MGPRLILLDGVRWKGDPVVGDRPQALLAALVGAGGRAVLDHRLVELIWRAEPLANATKGLQVVVSRARAIVGAGAVVRDGGGYRLGLPLAEVDSCLLAELAARARRLVTVEPAAAAAAARQALALGAALAPMPSDAEGPLAELRRAAAVEMESARAALAQASSRTGEHADALPLLTAAVTQRPDDEGLLADLLRSEAVVRGPGAALDRYERYRRDLRERLGASPGDGLARVQRDLLALDRPIRAGIRYDATRLLGRQRDLDQVRALLAGSRLASIVGPGGLGKTRLAHALARDSTLPVVHVVELVGISAAEDLLGEIGSALGVRDSLGNRRALTAPQRADLRARIAQQLSRGPALLVLDNCEHLVGAVAELVSFLVSATADLRVLTTSRAPLSISAERVYLLGELARPDAVELFRERAVAVRPGVRLDEADIGRIVDRLDGLPLAIELAAARARVMSVGEIDRRLADRFALLRGGDRGAPDRHRTLSAVIDWSWNLLAEPERRALRRLSVFGDGFTLDTAEEILGAQVVGTPVVDAVENLVDQSLLGVRETAGGVRYRMLETVREFGRLRLADAGELAAVARDRRDWAVRYAARHGADLFTERQFAAIDAVAAEETNLGDELRGALADGDVETTVRLVAVLAEFWEVRGEHTRILVLLGAVAEAVRDWQPRPETVSAAMAAGLALLSSAIAPLPDADVAPIRELLTRLGPDATPDPRLAGGVLVVLAVGVGASPGDVLATLDRFVSGGDRRAALTALSLLTHLHENSGDTRSAAVAAERALALARPQDGPWFAAMMHTVLAELTTRLGETVTAHAHAQAALPVLVRLGAFDDFAQLRTLLAFHAIGDGRFEAAEELLAGFGEDERLLATGTAPGTMLGSRLMVGIARAELAAGLGRGAEGLRLYLAAADRARALRLPGVEATGLEPWVLFGEAVALAASARHATTAAQTATGRDLYRSCVARCVRLIRDDGARVDFPVLGSVLFALGAWALRDGGPGPPADGQPAVSPPAVAAEDVVRLLALADRFGYNATICALDWAPVAGSAERRWAGRLARAQADLGQRRGAELLDEVRSLVEQLARGPSPPAHPLKVPPVGGHGQRQEDGDHHQAGEQRPADLPGDDAVVGQVPGGRDEM